MDAGGTNAVFATTHWSVVLAAGGTDTANAPLDALFRTYRLPLYVYTRRTGRNHHDAEDLIQAFFRRLLEKDALRQASQQRGRFRTFLLASLRNFLANEHDHATARKRGGGYPHVSLDDVESNNADGTGVIATNDPPERQFDREWAQTIFANALRQLEQEFAADGKQSQFAALGPFLCQPPAAGDYERVSGKIGIRPGLMPSVVSRLRQRFRDLVRAEIAATVATSAEVADELRYLVDLMVS